MNDVRALFRVLLLDEIKGRRPLKELAAILVLIVVLFCVVPSEYTAVHARSLGVLLKGTAAAALYLSLLSGLSKLNDRKYKLLLAMPVGKTALMLLYAAVVWIKHIGFRVMPFVLAILASNVSYRNITLLEGAGGGLMCAAAGLAACWCGISAVFFLDDRGFLRSRPERSAMKFGWIRREFVRFAGEKVLFLNHAGYSLFLVFFLYMSTAVSRAGVELILFLLVLLSTCSTPGVLFSWEKPYRQLLLSLPVSRGGLFAGKYIFALAIMFPLYAAAYGIVCAFGPGLDRWGLLAMMAISLGLTTLVKLYYDMKRPNYDWSHPRQMFEHKRKYMLWLISVTVSAPLMVYSYMSIWFAGALQMVFAGCLLYAIRKGRTQG